MSQESPGQGWKLSLTWTPMGASTVLERGPGPQARRPTVPGFLCTRITSENVAERFGISRQKQDAFALASQRK